MKRLINPNKISKERITIKFIRKKSIPRRIEIKKPSGGNWWAF
jgi:hypothetical protein